MTEMNVLLYSGVMNILFSVFMENGYRLHEVTLIFSYKPNFFHKLYLKYEVSWN
jgi:hypothetical protein